MIGRAPAQAQSGDARSSPPGDRMPDRSSSPKSAGTPMNWRFGSDRNWPLVQMLAVVVPGYTKWPPRPAARIRSTPSGRRARSASAPASTAIPATSETDSLPPIRASLPAPSPRRPHPAGRRRRPARRSRRPRSLPGCAGPVRSPVHPGRSSWRPPPAGSGAGFSVSLPRARLRDWRRTRSGQEQAPPGSRRGPAPRWSEAPRAVSPRTRSGPSRP